MPAPAASLARALAAGALLALGSPARAGEPAGPAASDFAPAVSAWQTRSAAQVRRLVPEKERLSLDLEGTGDGRVAGRPTRENAEAILKEYFAKLDSATLKDVTPADPLPLDDEGAEERARVEDDVAAAEGGLPRGRGGEVVGLDRRPRPWQLVPRVFPQEAVDVGPRPHLLEPLEERRAVAPGGGDRGVEPGERGARAGERARERLLDVAGGAREDPAAKRRDVVPAAAREREARRPEEEGRPGERREARGGRARGPRRRASRHDFLGRSSTPTSP